MSSKPAREAAGRVRLRVCLVQRSGCRDQVHEGDRERSARCLGTGLRPMRAAAQHLPCAFPTSGSPCEGQRGKWSWGCCVREFCARGNLRGQHHRVVSQKSAGLMHEANAGKRCPLAVPWDWGGC